MRRFGKKDGGFGSEKWSKGHLCTVGNTARALVKFGYVDDKRLQFAVKLLKKKRRRDGKFGHSPSRC